MRIEHMESAVRPGWTMNELKAEPLDFVRDFQEYLDQQTHHVNTLSSSVNGEKSDEDLRTGERVTCSAPFEATPLKCMKCSFVRIVDGWSLLCYVCEWCVSCFRCV